MNSVTYMREFVKEQIDMSRKIIYFLYELLYDKTNLIRELSFIHCYPKNGK